jgi:chemotaxis protein histidine kinase CheA
MKLGLTLNFLLKCSILEVRHLVGAFSMDKKYQDLFITSAAEHIEKLRIDVDQFKQTTDKQIMNQLHIHAHSLKGEALIMGYKQLGRYCLVLERFFKQCLQEEKAFMDEYVSAVIEAIDHLKECLQCIKESLKEPDLEERIQNLEQRLGVTSI